MVGRTRVGGRRNGAWVLDFEACESREMDD